MKKNHAPVRCDRAFPAVFALKITPAQSIRSALLGLTALSPLTALHVAEAQTVVPPSSGPCVVAGATATCTGDVSAGVDADGPTITTLNLNTLTQNIAPAVGIDAINFATSAANITVNLDVGAFQAIVPAGASTSDVVDATVTGSGNITINSTGTLVNNGTGNGLLGNVTASGNIGITSVGNITTQGGAGILGLVGDSGNVTINSTGTITVTGAPFVIPGPFATIVGISGASVNAGDVFIQSTGNVVVSGGASAIGIRANDFIGLPNNRTVTVISVGNVTASGSFLSPIGISAGNNVGPVIVSSTGNVIADRGISALAATSGDLTVNSNGNITSTTVGIEATTPSGTANITVDGGTVVGADGITVNAATTGASTISVLAGGTVQGTGTTATDRGIEIASGAANVSVAGTVTGGTGGAIQFAPGTFNDRLDLLPGFTVTGNVFADAGTDTLRFDGPGNGAFDLSLIDTGTNTQQYRQFETFEVNNGVWTFSNATTAAFVANGGTTTGNATFGGMTVNNGATLAPGVGQGTMNINGNLAFNAGSILAVDLNPDATSDLISVTGTAAISDGGTSLNATLNPLVVPTTATTWTVVDATGGVSGQFTTVTDNLPDVDLTAVYNPTTVQLVFTPGAPPPAVGILPPGATSPKEIHPSAQMAALHSSLLFVETMRRRADLTNFQLGDALAEAEPFGEPPEVRSQAAKGNVADASRPQWGIWGAGMGSYTDVSNQGTVTGWEAREAGIAVGLEGRVTTEAGIPITVGAAVGAIRSDVESGTSDAKIDSWHLGLYAAAKIDRLSIGGAAAYAYHDYDFTRPIAFGGGSVTADGGADGHSLTASMEAFFNMAPDPEGDAYIGPVGSVGLAYGNRGSFTETGAGVLNLSVSDDKALQAKTQIGIAAGLEREIEGMKVKLDARLQWEHVFGDTSVTTTSAIPVAGASFSTSSAAVDRDRLGVGLGAGLGISENATAHIRYDGAFGADTETHAISGGVTFWF